MTKLKLKNWSKVGDALTSEDLKHVYGGGTASGSGTGSRHKSCVCVYTVINVEDWSEYDKSEIIPNIYSELSCTNNCNHKCLLNTNIWDCEAIYDYI